MPLSIDKVTIKKEVEKIPKILQSTKGQTKGHNLMGDFWSKQDFSFDLQITLASCLHCPSFSFFLFFSGGWGWFLFFQKNATVSFLNSTTLPAIPDLFSPFPLLLHPTETRVVHDTSSPASLDGWCRDLNATLIKKYQSWHPLKCTRLH